MMTTVTVVGKASGESPDAHREWGRLTHDVTEHIARWARLCKAGDWDKSDLFRQGLVAIVNRIDELLALDPEDITGRTQSASTLAAMILIANDQLNELSRFARKPSGLGGACSTLRDGVMHVLNRPGDPDLEEAGKAFRKGFQQILTFKCEPYTGPA